MVVLRLLTSLSTLAAVVAQTPPTLEFVEIWFRHGERIPTHYVYFPNEKPTVPYTEAEAGELTNRGIQQAYTRGQSIRDRYGSFLGDVYRPSQLRIWTGNDNRTVASAEAVLAAIFEPDDAHKWSKSLNWQPVVVHTDPTIDWVSTGINGNCPGYEKTFFESPAYQEVLAPFDSELIVFLENNTGVHIDTPITFNHIIDALKTKLALNDSRLPFPKWAEPIRDNVSSISHLFHERMLDAQNETVGRYHVEMLLSFIEDHMARPQNAKNKAVFLSGHDTNILTLGRQLDISELSSQMASYAAMVTIELHQSNGTYYVELWYSPSVDAQLTRLDIPQCATPCKLDRINELFKERRVTKSAWESQCLDTRSQVETGIVTASMILLLGVFIVSTVVLACTTFSYRKQLKELQDPERRHLLDES